MRMQRVPIFTLDDAGSDWFDAVLWLWTQDECAPDGETRGEALLRFSGLRLHVDAPLALRDEGDFDLTLFRGGWVVGFGPGPRSGQVGVVVRPMRPARVGRPQLQVFVNVDRLGASR